LRIFKHFPAHIGGSDTTIVSHARRKALWQGRAAKLLVLPLVTNDAAEDQKPLEMAGAELHLDTSPLPCQHRIRVSGAEVQAATWQEKTAGCRNLRLDDPDVVLSDIQWLCTYLIYREWLIRQG
jgi:hypothetical protein